MVNRTIPKLRFKEFNSQWQTKQLSKLATVKDGTHSSPKKVQSGYPLITSKNLEYGYLTYNDVSYISKTDYDKINRRSNVSKGDILFGMIGAYIGRPALMTNICNFAIKNVALIKKSNNVYNYWLLYLLESNVFRRYIHSIHSGSAKGFLGLTQTRNFQFDMPTIIEQRQIGTFFATLDHLIQMQQKKVSLLKRLKKAYLQKLFPRKGENMPRMRFKGFQNKWDEITINKLIVKGKSGGTPSKNNNKYYGGNIPFLSINDVTSSSGHINKTTKSITSLGLNNSSAWIIPKGSLILLMYASVGEVAQNNINLATSQAFFNMIYESSITTEMMYYVFQYIKLIHGWRPFINTGTQGNLNAHTIRQFIVKLPSLKEQRYISLFLKNLDINIHIQIDVSNNLSRLKKAYLQKMFC